MIKYVESLVRSGFFIDRVEIAFIVHVSLADNIGNGFGAPPNSYTISNPMIIVAEHRATSIHTERGTAKDLFF
jgi:hypothetical protein